MQNAPKIIRLLLDKQVNECNKHAYIGGHEQTTWTVGGGLLKCLCWRRWSNVYMDVSPSGTLASATKN